VSSTRRHYYDLGFVAMPEDRLAEPTARGRCRVEAAEARATRGPATAPRDQRLQRDLRFGSGRAATRTHEGAPPRVVERIAPDCHFGTDLFDTELILRVERAGLPVVELPSSVVERRPSRSPDWRRVPRTLWGSCAAAPAWRSADAVGRGSATAPGSVARSVWPEPLPPGAVPIRSPRTPWAKWRARSRPARWHRSRPLVCFATPTSRVALDDAVHALPCPAQPEK